MSKIESLFCPECGHATMQIHPEANPKIRTPFNEMYKCGHCGYTTCKHTHEEKTNKMPKPELGKGKKYF